MTGRLPVIEACYRCPYASRKTHSEDMGGSQRGTHTYFLRLYCTHPNGKDDGKIFDNSADEFGEHFPIILGEIDIPEWCPLPKAEK